MLSEAPALWPRSRRRTLPEPQPDPATFVERLESGRSASQGSGRTAGDGAPDLCAARVERSRMRAAASVVTDHKPHYAALIFDSIALTDCSNSAIRASTSAFTCWNALSPVFFNSPTFR